MNEIAITEIKPVGRDDSMQRIVQSKHKVRQYIFNTCEQNKTPLIASQCPCSPGSEAGGEDALVGNVSKLMVSPPGYSGATRKGHLVFDACFESGEYKP